jgi:hypothetical protein
MASSVPTNLNSDTGRQHRANVGSNLLKVKRVHSPIIFSELRASKSKKKAKRVGFGLAERHERKRPRA